MYCKKCGFQLPNDAEYCPNCGTKVEINGVEDIAKKAVFGKIEKDEETDIESINEKAHWNDQQEQNKNVTAPPKIVERKKIICTKGTNLYNIRVKYYGYEDDKSLQRPFWYENQAGTYRSEKFENVFFEIINNSTMVEKGGKWACGRFEGNIYSNWELKIITKYVFDDADLVELENGQCCFLLKDNRKVYMYDGVSFYKTKKRIDIIQFLKEWIIVFFVILMICICISFFIGLFSGLFSGLNLKEALNAPIDDTTAYTILIITALISIIGPSYYMSCKDKSSYTNYIQGDKVLEFL